MKKRLILLIIVIVSLIMLSSCGEALTYQITFDSVGGTLIESEVVERGEKISKPNDPFKDNFLFEHWTVNDKEFDFNTKVTKKLTLKAKYSYIGVDEITNYQGRKYNSVFDSLISDFNDINKLSNNSDKVSLDNEAPYLKISYSKEIGNDYNKPLYKEINVNNNYSFLVLRLRGFLGASLDDFSLVLTVGESNEIIVKELNKVVRQNKPLTNEWENYIINLKELSSLKINSFALVNTSLTGSGVLEIKDVYYSKLASPSYPYEGSNYYKNEETKVSYLGENVTNYLTIESNGYYGDKLVSGNFNDSYLVLTLKQISSCSLSLDDLKVSLLFSDNTEGDKYQLSNVYGLTSLGSNFLNIMILVNDLNNSEKVVVGFKLYNESNLKIALKEAFFTYFGEYEEANYPLLDFSNVLILENFNREEIGNINNKTEVNEIAINNGFEYIVSNSGLELSYLEDGYLNLNSNNKIVDYQIYATSKKNYYEYRYLVIKYQLEEEYLIDYFSLKQITSEGNYLNEVEINSFKAGIGYPSLPNNLNNYSLYDGKWAYLVVDLLLTEGFNGDFSGFELNFKGKGLILDAFFFANKLSEKEESSKLLWGSFDELEEGIISNNPNSYQEFVSSNGITENIDNNMVLVLDGNNEEFYQTKTFDYGRYLELKIKTFNESRNESLKLTINNQTRDSKEKTIILENGLPLTINADGNWHTYIIDLLLSDLNINGELKLSLSGDNSYYIDDLTWYNKILYYDDEFILSDFEDFELGSLDNQEDDNLIYIDSFETNVNVVSINNNNLLKIDSSASISRIDFGVMDYPDIITFNLTIEREGVLSIYVGGKDLLLTDLLDQEGNKITLPNLGETKEIVIDLLLSNLEPNDVFGFKSINGIYYIDDISFKFKDKYKNMITVFEETFNSVPIVDDDKYLWGDFDYINDGYLKLIDDGILSYQFESNLIKNASYMKFIIKVEEGYDGSSLILELGENNFIPFARLVSDGYATELNDWFIEVIIPLEKYTNIRDISIIGFYINHDGVVIDNLTFLTNEYINQMLIFTDEEIK